MADLSDPPGAGEAHAVRALEVLADRVTLATLLAVADAGPAGIPTVAMVEATEALGTARAVRDRARRLGRDGVLTLAPPARDRDAPRWTTTTAGDDLVRTHALVARIICRAAALPASASPATRDRVVERGLHVLADPACTEIARRLARGDGTTPDELEGSLALPRRTLYRRLSVLMDGGAVTRTTTGGVPRRTTYRLVERWRPAVAALVLAAWWEARHGAGGGSGFDLGGTLLYVAPTARLHGVRAGTQVIWVVDDAFGPRSFVLRAGERGEIVVDRMGDDQVADGASPVTRAAAGPAAWTDALVADARAGVTVTGDERAADAFLSAVRLALLAYLR